MFLELTIQLVSTKVLVARVALSTAVVEALEPSFRVSSVIAFPCLKGCVFFANWTRGPSLVPRALVGTVTIFHVEAVDSGYTYFARFWKGIQAPAGCPSLKLGVSFANDLDFSR